MHLETRKYIGIQKLFFPPFRTLQPSRFCRLSKFAPYRWRPCGVTWDADRYILQSVIKAAAKTALSVGRRFNGSPQPSPFS